MTRRVAACALATLTLLVAGTSPARAEPIEAGPEAEALWAWSWDSSAELADLATADGISRVYLYCQGGFDHDVRETIAALGAAGVEVEALGGETRWATTQRADMLRFVRAAVRYQRGALAGARLTGIHLDVEPYGLPAWDRDQRAVAGSLTRAMEAAERAARSLPLAADIPFWFDEIPTGGGASLAEQMIRRTDAITVMAYRDQGSDVIDVARREVRLAGRAGKPVTVGVETSDVAPEQVTFFEEGRTALELALAEVRAELGSHAGFGGVAVHDSESLRALPNG